MTDTLKPDFNTFDSPHDLMNYLEITLIPDLRRSGNDATADDFEDCANHLRVLLSEREDILNVTMPVSDGRYPLKQFAAVKKVLR